MIYVIVINYNGSSETIECLRALEKQTFSEFEIILIDNASLDNSVIQLNDFLRSYPLSSSVRFVRLETNRGFAGGNIEGMKYADGRFVALLNNDTIPDKTWLEELVTNMENHSGVGICASKLLMYNSDRIDSAGDGYTRTLKGFKNGEGDQSIKFNTQRLVFGACAGAALYRREMLDQIFFLDEDFFLIHEDTDLNFRAQLAGWKVLYVPTAVVHHKVRSSIGNMSDLAVYYTLRNSEFVRIKNVPFWVFMRCVPEFILGVISEFLYFAIKHKKLKLFMKAKMDAIKMFPRMWQKRKIIIRTRKVSNVYLLSLMTPIWQKDFFKVKLGKFLHD
jgi:hypothetical protein